MTESQLFEKVGRLGVENDSLRLEYSRLLLLLGQVLAGEVAPERVTIDLAGQTWTLLPAIPAGGATEEAGK